MERGRCLGFAGGRRRVQSAPGEERCARLGADAWVVRGSRAAHASVPCSLMDQLGSWDAWMGSLRL